MSIINAFGFSIVKEQIKLQLKNMENVSTCLDSNLNKILESNLSIDNVFQSIKLIIFSLKFKTFKAPLMPQNHLQPNGIIKINQNILQLSKSVTMLEIPISSEYKILFLLLLELAWARSFLKIIYFKNTQESCMTSIFGNSRIIIESFNINSETIT